MSTVPASGAEAPENSSPSGIPVRIHSVGAGGEGVGTLPDGRVVFVRRTAPGDRVAVEVETDRSSWARARPVELLEAGPGRREPPCPLYDRCGGCSLQHLRYRDQLAAKGAMVEDALQRIGKLEPPPSVEVEPSSSEFGTRSRMSFHLRRGPGGRVETGLHRVGHPGRLVEVDGVCLLPRPVLARTWSGLRSAWGPGARRLPDGPALRLTLREVDEGAVLVVEPEAGAAVGDAGTGEAGELVAAVEELVAVWLRTGPGEVELLAGDGEAVATWWGRPIRTGAGAFLQAHREAAVRLHETLLREVGNPAGRRFVDAYCGVGTTGRRLARAGGRVTGIELDPEAVRAAREGAPPDFRVLAGTVEDRLPEALPADTVILNPPRAGADAAVTDRLRESPGVRRIAYVSCDPATLARDVRRLGPAFEVRSIRSFDLFPETAHVETLLVLDRDPPPSFHP